MGFLYTEEAKKELPPKRKSNQYRQHEVGLRNYYNAQGCSACSLDRYDSILKCPKMDAKGDAYPWIYILSDAPGKEEDEKGDPIVGLTARRFEHCAWPIWPADMFSRSRRNTVINCYTTSPSTPQAIDFVQIEACRSRVVKDIEQTAPEFILCLGKTASQWVTDDSADIKLWRGRWTPAKIGHHICWTFHTFNPTHIPWKGDPKIYGESDEMKIFRLDLKKFSNDITSKALGQPYIFDSGHLDDIVLVTGHEETRLAEWDIDIVEQGLKEFSKEDLASVDLETSGLSPTKEPGAKILCAAVSTYDRTLSFAIDHSESGWTPEQNVYVHKLFREFLLSPASKIAHNTPFEQMWLVHFYGPDIINKVRWHDTQAQAVAIDQRIGMLSLDALTRQYLGFHIKTLSGVDAGRASSYPLDTLLPYCGLDAKYLLPLYHFQFEVIRQAAGLQTTVDNIIDTGGTMTLAHLNGLDVDFDKLNSLDSWVQQELEAALWHLDQLPAVAQVKKRFGDFDPKSNLHLAYLFRDVLNRQEGRKGKSYSTDAKILSKMKDEPCAEGILKFREFEKLRSTYIEGMRDTLHADNKLHPEFTTMLTQSGRLSSKGPNIQNFPQRRHSEVREIIKPPPGHVVASFDYGQIEARCIAMESLDLFFIEAIWTNYDIHTHWAKRIGELHPPWLGSPLGLDDPEVKKAKRQEAKNQWVFAMFYGSSHKPIADAMKIPVDIAFELYTEFWEQFKGVRQWQYDTIAKYEQTGYCENLFGRRRQGPLSRNEILNTPTQGCASDIVTRAGNRLRQKHNIIPAFNVHDDLTFFLLEETLDEQIQIIATEMTQPTEPWMIVPLVVELKVGDVWGKQVEIANFSSVELHNHTRS